MLELYVHRRFCISRLFKDLLCLEVELVKEQNRGLFVASTDIVVKRFILLVMHGYFGDAS